MKPDTYDEVVAQREAERIENAHLREAFVTMEKAYNEAEAKRCETCRFQTDRGYCDNSAINIEGAGWVRVTCEAFGNGCRAWARREP